ncbi:hypothetical protein V8E53_012580 [Lactarius tabidus]
MKSAFLLFSSFLLVAAVNGSAVLEARTVGNYVQDASGNAGFSIYSGCSNPACGQSATGYTAAMNQLSFGAESGPGDACGRCFSLSGTVDPNTGSTGPFNSIVVKVTDLCSVQEEYCGQTLSNPTGTDSLAQPMHFQLCSDSGASGAF